MAYAAVMSLMYTIKGLVDSSHIPIDSSTREILLSAFDHALSLQRKLEKCSAGEEDMEKQIFIIEAAHKLEDAIEFPLLSQPPTFFFNLQHHVDCFVRTAKEGKEIIKGLWEQKAAKIIEEDVQELFVQKPSKPDQEEEAEDIEMVGLCDQFLQIRDYLLADERDERPVWISGMAGIGKTRLAKKILDDPLVKTNFQRLAFVRVGKKCRSKQSVLQAIIDQVSHDHNGGMSIQVDGDLLQIFYKIFSVKSLIVLDDVWYENPIPELFTETWRKEIHILVTSRNDEIFPLSRALKIRFMDVAESWELLRKKVFGKEEECPSQLVKPGKKIAEKCEGLPLLINNVASILLSTTQKDPESWNRVAEKPDSILEKASYQISEVLLSSYHEIDDVTKLCFLFMAAFPRSSIVSCSTTINLWRVEGIRSFFPENDFADENIDMMVLIWRNLVVGHQQRWSETHRAYSLHCAYWYLSRRIAQNIKFLYIIKSSSDDLDESIKSHRRLAIQENVLLVIKEVHDKITSILTVRSLLCTGPYLQYQVPICWEWKLLRVLHVLTVRFYEFPIEVVKLIRLRYLALTCNANLPPSISKLCNLEFLIVHQHLSIKRVAVVSYVPVEIWDLQQLKHLEIIGKNLPDPRPGAVLPNLTKLLNVGVESCTKGVLESIPQLEKLRIQIELGPDDAQTLSLFDHISSLEELKSFQIIILNSTLLRPPPPLSMFTSSLRKLSLSGFGYSWADMTKIVELTQLQVLKLKCYAFRGEKWEVKGMVFERLWYLLIEDTDLREWTGEYESFPWLRRLTMKNCHKLQEIPLFSFEDIPGTCIELVDCNPLAETCAKQRYSTAERITASYSWKGKKLKP